jgi:hypothetical protein
MSDNVVQRLYDTYRKQIEWEDSLYNQRLTWLIALQAFLLFPFVTLLTSDLSLTLAKLDASTQVSSALAEARHQTQETIKVLKLVIAGIGLVSTLFAYASCAAAMLRILRLSKEYDERSSSIECKECNAWSPAIRSHPFIHWTGTIASHGFIFLFSGVWGGLLWFINDDIYLWTVGVWVVWFLMGILLYLEMKCPDIWRKESFQSSRKPDPTPAGQPHDTSSTGSKASSV